MCGALACLHTLNSKTSLCTYVRIQSLDRECTSAAVELAYFNELYSDIRIYIYIYIYIYIRITGNQVCQTIICFQADVLPFFLNKL